MAQQENNLKIIVTLDGKLSAQGIAQFAAPAIPSRPPSAAGINNNSEKKAPAPKKEAAAPEIKIPVLNITFGSECKKIVDLQHEWKQHVIEFVMPFPAV